MSKLLNIEGIEEEHLDVFEAVGIGELVDLASSDPSGLHSELLEANEMLALVDEVPEFSVLEGWVEKARKEVPQAVLDSLESTGEEPMMEEFVEVEDEGAIDGESVLVAQALSRQDLKAEGIKVSEIPEAIYISEDKLTESRKTEQGFKTMGESLSVGRLEKAKSVKNEAPVDLSKVQSISEVQEGDGDCFHRNLSRRKRRNWNCGLCRRTNNSDYSVTLFGSGEVSGVWAKAIFPEEHA